MKKLCFIVLFTVSHLAFAHCGTCGVGEKKTVDCSEGSGSECASKEASAHHATHHGPAAGDADASTTQIDEENSANTKK